MKTLVILATVILIRSCSPVKEEKVETLDTLKVDTCVVDSTDTCKTDTICKH